jgi:hypothetical protein
MLGLLHPTTLLQGTLGKNSALKSTTQSVGGRGLKPPGGELWLPGSRVFVRVGRQRGQVPVPSSIFLPF